MDLGLKGRVALVAGASQGIGAATARLLAAEGARLVLVSRRPDPIAAELEAETEAIGLAADLSRSSEADRAVAAALARFGRLDVLVISIGAAQGGTFWEIGDGVWEEALALKFMGMVRLMRAAAPAMRDARSGSMVAVIGNNGRQPHPRMLPGSAANAACLAVVTGLAQELAPHGVRVNAVNPGPTRTARWDRLMQAAAERESRGVEEIEAGQRALIPTGALNTPEEVARLVVMLASGLAPGLTGTALTVDGAATRGLA